MALPELRVVAEGETSGGEHWYLRAGGTADDYYTMLKTVHPDGHWDEGGIGGPPLYPGSPYNSYTGRAGNGPLRVIVRTDPRVRRLRFGSAAGRSCEMMMPAAQDPAVGLAFFAILLPWTTTRLVGLQGFDAAGQPLE
jgi:hypothetical protein